MIRRGTTRFVIVLAGYAFKFARNDLGKRCNQFEADLYRSCSEVRRDMLCPTLWCSRSGFLAIARKARPISEQEAAQLRRSRGFPDWDYLPGGRPCPFEHKAADWGRIDGRLVAVDYAAGADENVSGTKSGEPANIR